MTSLFASLGVAREALLAQQMALNVTQNNISNVNTPGYTRQRANLVPGEPVAQYAYESGMGVRLDSIDAFRDRLLDYRLNQELHRHGAQSYASTALQQVEALFNEHAGMGLQSALSAFFNSFGALANAPEDMSLRQQVLARAADLAGKVRGTYEQVQSIRDMQARTVTDTVQEINTLAGAIARINAEVATVQGTNGNESVLRDQRQQMMDRMAQLVDVAYFESESGTVTVMTPQGALLVVGTDSYAWSSVSGPDDIVRIQSGGADITSKIRSGKLGGLLQVRDVLIPGYLAALDELASAVIARVNDQHALGADLDGVPGGDFFAPFTPPGPGSVAGAARSMSLAITDPRGIAAAEIGAGPGDNTNARALAGIQNEAIMAGGATVDQHYANLIFRIGLDTASARDGLQTQDVLLAQLRNQRDAESGVSLDEEAVDLIRFQRAYEANARMIRLIDSLTEEVIRLLGD
ncbi:MAG: flagellar hook-associated protein FlgK [Acidobacteria bacterium]|nr:flagellar hook-associated protein FlgK [Acidobacteriota bacterium]